MSELFLSNVTGASAPSQPNVNFINLCSKLNLILASNIDGFYHNYYSCSALAIAVCWNWLEMPRSLVCM